MKSSTANQSPERATRINRIFNRTAWAVAAAAASLLTGAMTSSAGQKDDCSTNIRPIEDFLEAQGKAYPPPFYMVGFWDPETGLLMVVDYAGLIDHWLKESSDGTISLSTEIDGSVIERPLADGRAEVTVLCHTRNADVAVAPVDDPFNVFLGNDPFALLAGEEPALGDSFMKWVFINDAPGAPLPDLNVVCFDQPQNMISLLFEASGTGPLSEAFGVPDGTPGRAQMTHVEREGPHGLWLLGHIKLHALGH